MKFLMLIKHPESYRSQTVPQSLMDAMGEFVTANLKSGVLKDTAGLKPTSDGRFSGPYSLKGDLSTATMFDSAWRTAIDRPIVCFVSTRND